MKVWLNNDNLVLSDDYLASLKEEANRLLKGLVTFTSRWDMEQCRKEVLNPSWDHVEDEDVEWLYQNNRHSYLEALVITYLKTKEEKYLTHFNKIVTSWLDECEFLESNFNGVWRSLEAGIRARNWLFYIQLLGDNLDSTLKERMEESLLIHGKYLEDTYTAFHRLSNWGVLQDEGLFCLAIYFNREDWKNLVIKRMCNNIENSVMNDGSHWEQSPMYTGEVLSGFTTVILLAQQHNIQLPAWFVNKVHKMALAFSAFVKNNGLLYPYGDTDCIDARDLVALTALVFKDSYLKDRAQNDGWDRINLYCSAQQIEDYKRLEAKANNNSIALTDSGNYFLKRGKLEVHFATGTLGSGHGHADNLALQVRYDNKDVFIDPGRYTYKDCKKRYQLKSAEYHNTYTIDNKGFSVPIGTWSYESIAPSLPSFHSFTESIDFVQGSHLGYAPLTSARFVFRLLDEAILICDKVYGEKEHKIEEYYNFLARYEESLDFNGLKIKDDDLTCYLHVANGVLVDFSTCDISHHYNELEEGKRLIISKNVKEEEPLSTLICFNKAKFEIGRVGLVTKKEELMESEAVSYRITTKNHEYVIMIIEKEKIGGVDFYTAFGYEGYGRVITFVDGKKTVLKY